MKLNKFLTFLLPALLLASAVANAAPNWSAVFGGSNDAWVLLLILLALVLPLVAAPVLAFISYRRATNPLTGKQGTGFKIAAWVMTVLLMFVARAFENVLGSACTSVAALSFGLLLESQSKKTSGNWFIYLNLVANMCYLMAFKGTVHGICNLMERFNFFSFIAVACDLVIQYVFEGFLLLRLLKIFKTSGIAVNSVYKVLAWSAGIGFGSVIVYMLLYFHHFAGMLFSMAQQPTGLLKEAIWYIAVGVAVYLIDREQGKRALNK